MQLGRGETIGDTARVLSRYVDAIMIRALDPEAVAELARLATVPVINGLTRRSHPCQVMADVMTFEEHRGPIRGRTVAWTGDANNVLTSWMHAAERFAFRMRVATPPELAPKKPLLGWIKSSGVVPQVGLNPAAAAVEQLAHAIAGNSADQGDTEQEQYGGLHRMELPPLRRASMPCCRKRGPRAAKKLETMTRVRPTR